MSPKGEKMFRPSKGGPSGIAESWENLDDATLKTMGLFDEKMARGQRGGVWGGVVGASSVLGVASEMLGDLAGGGAEQDEETVMTMADQILHKAARLHKNVIIPLGDTRVPKRYQSGVLDRTVSRMEVRFYGTDKFITRSGQPTPMSSVVAEALHDDLALLDPRKLEQPPLPMDTFNFPDKRNCEDFKDESSEQLMLRWARREKYACKVLDDEAQVGRADEKHVCKVCWRMRHR